MHIFTTNQSTTEYSLDKFTTTKKTNRIKTNNKHGQLKLFFAVELLEVFNLFSPSRFEKQSLQYY